jgi:hypothetical protein
MDIQIFLQLLLKYDKRPEARLTKSMWPGLPICDCEPDQISGRSFYKIIYLSSEAWSVVRVSSSLVSFSLRESEPYKSPTVPWNYPSGFVKSKNL